jgi:hypothetical protein
MESSGVTNLPSCLPNSLTFRFDRVQPDATRNDKHGNYGFYRFFDPPNLGDKHYGFTSERTHLQMLSCGYPIGMDCSVLSYS